MRQTAPVFGAATTPYQAPGEWDITLAFRGLRADTHYRGRERSFDRQEKGTFVVNRQRVLHVSATYAPTRRVALTVTIPYVTGSWSIPVPTEPRPGPRVQLDSRGFGDVTTVVRYWLFEPGTHHRGNIEVGGGIKLPTGKYDARDVYPDYRGLDPAPRPVDQSIQPGDGGWGIVSVCPDKPALQAGARSGGRTRRPRRSEGRVGRSFHLKGEIIHVQRRRPCRPRHGPVGRKRPSLLRPRV